MNVQDVFLPDGLLGKKFSNYEYREAQLNMATLVNETITSGGHAVIEGETGVGKSFGYLVPILLSGRQAIVSTSNKSLQDQLNLKDLPALKELLPVEVNWIVLKGKSNYFCTEHFESARNELKETYGMSDFELQEMAKWAHESEHHGDMDFYPTPLNPKVRELVTCDSDTKHDKDSKMICYANEARRLAKSANVVLVNHSLLAIDLSLRIKSEGKAKIIPSHGVVVMDEAHAFDQYASMAFSIELSMRSLYHLLDWSEVKHALNPTERGKLVTNFKRSLNKYVPNKGKTGYYEHLEVSKFDGFEYVIQAMSDLRGKLANVDTDKLNDVGRIRIQRIKKECENLRDKLVAMGEENEDELRWSEAREYGGDVQVTIKSVPLDISELLKVELYPKRSVIATSATLSSGGSFDFFKQQMGMPDTTKELVAHSPFDFQNNALMYITNGQQDKVSELERLLNASQGRAFVLFTSYKEMRYMYDAVNVPFPKFIQEGRVNRRELLETFKSTPNAVLFATKSFWEGVDVQGDGLSLVVIDKLPFGNPYEPLFKAKQNRVEKKYGKGTGFIKYAVPEACIVFKQGVGRLIRSTTDKGVIAVLDGRMNYARYAAAFDKSAPRNIYKTQRLENVEAFFKKIG